MQKRIFVLLVSMVMVFMSACGASEEAKTMYELYTQSSEALKDADSLEMKMSMNMAMDYEGEVFDITMSGLIKEVIKSETDVQMQMDMTMDMMGISVDTISYYKDGIYYMDVMGERTKEPMSIEEAIQQSNASTFEFPASAIKNEVLNEVGDTKEISFTLDSSALNNELLAQMGSLTETLGEDTNIVFGDVELKVVLDKSNNLKSFSMAFPMELNAEGELITYDMDIEIEIVKVGGITIEFPSDLDTY